MGLFDEFKKLTRPYDDEDFFDDEGNPAVAPRYRGGEQESAPERVSPFSVDPVQPKSADKRNVSKVVNINASSQLAVVLVKPERFETAAEIADQLREKRAVLMNLEHTGKDVARRLIDFLSGVAYAQDGKIKKVATNTYIITPFNVDLMGDNLMDEFETSGVYF